MDIPKNMPKSKILLRLFLSTLYLSTFTFGGGYVIVTLLNETFVDRLHWIDDEEMLDLVAIAQASPGAIAVNGAIVVGYKLAGIPGILASVLGAVIPPFVILSVISVFYSAFSGSFAVQAVLAGMKAGVSAVIMSVVWDMGSGVVRSGDRLGIFLMAAAFIANYFLHVNVIFIIAAAALTGIARALLSGDGSPSGSDCDSVPQKQTDGRQSRAARRQHRADAAPSRVRREEGEIV